MSEEMEREILERVLAVLPSELQADARAELQRLTYHKPTPEQSAAMESLASAIRSLAVQIIIAVPRGRERALALTALQEVRMRANAGIILEGSR